MAKAVIMHEINPKMGEGVAAVWRSFTRPQKTVRSKECHVGDLRQLHGRCPEASANK
jgi:hypothetical protein